MMTLGNHHHDFPHLAKQSGFYFQLHRGKVNWEEIENLEVNDIVENRNFQLLEQNLSNVVNCNLEKEYDLKVLDQNFVKLFKIAQLGVDYLSYCEAYLDKCVVILQEQLLAFQEECESLKYEREKRKEEGINSGRKSKTRSYQCEKCDKAFISDVYLKFHHKRRHNIPNTPKSSDRSVRNCADNSQQTEYEEKPTASTQTSSPNGRPRTTLDEEDTAKIKEQHAAKIENLEQEIQDLKERLKKAENALTEKTEASKPNGFSSSFPGPTCHNTMLLLLPSCQTRSASAYEEVKPTVLVTTPEILQQNHSQAQAPPEPKMTETKPSSENPSQFITESENISDKEQKGLTKARVEFHPTKENAGSFSELRNKTEEHFECEKENIDPNKPSKPLPPPRKSKKVIPTRLGAEGDATAELSAPQKRNTQPQSEAESFVSQPALVTSTPVKRRTSSDAFQDSREGLGDLNKRVSISNESLNSRKSALVDDSSASFFKAIMRKKSPKFRTLGQNIRRSLTNLCDSVSSTGKDFMKKEPGDRNARAAVVDGLNNRLRQLGVDPEWSGIPKKTMKQKLKALKHRRKLLAKENPMYSVIRQNLEETIFQKLKKNFGSKGATLTKKLTEQASDIDDPRELAPKNEPEGVRPQSCVMYDIESDSESKTSDSEIDFDENAMQNVSQKTAEFSGEPDLVTPDSNKEFDLTVFQVGKGSFQKTARKDISVKVEELTDSDSDTSEENSSKTLKDGIAQDNDERHKSGNQTILKGADGLLQSTLQLNSKKKVWFNSGDLEGGLSDSPTEEDELWSLKSDWEKNLG